MKNSFFALNEVSTDLPSLELNIVEVPTCLYENCFFVEFLKKMDFFMDFRKIDRNCASAQNLNFFEIFDLFHSKM